MTVLVVGATGATGRRLVAELLERGHDVRAFVRSPDRLPAALRRNDRLFVIPGSALDLGDDALRRHVAGCAAVASCLGHNLTWSGVFGPPRRLVADTAARLCRAIEAAGPPAPVRFVLMNTAGNRDRDLREPLPRAERLVLAVLRRVLPPHADNEAAADVLRTGVGRGHRSIEWVVVRPDTLTEADDVADYEVHPSPTRSAIFNAGATSRRNVARFMADLISDDDTWTRWKGRMPVIYDRGKG